MFKNLALFAFLTQVLGGGCMMGALSGCSVKLTNTEITAKAPGISFVADVPVFQIDFSANPIETAKWLGESIINLFEGKDLPLIPRVITQVPSHRIRLASADIVYMYPLSLRARAVIALGVWALDKSREAHRYKSTLRVRAVTKI